MNLNKESLEILSDCILSKMEQISKVNKVSTQLSNSINKELQMLQELNSKVCKELDNRDEPSIITERNNSNKLL